jgi:bloom syndrome protein
MIFLVQFYKLISTLYIFVLTLYYRPDYNALGTLRQEYPKVPLMALTATANEKVVNDAVRALRMKNEYRYRSSFNRPNLRYEVRRKDGKVIDTIAEYVSGRPNDSGVIYCLSRRNCEDLSEKLQAKLRESGQGHVIVSFYHADLDATERQRRHKAWSVGRISVLCATIAFGMGIVSCSYIVVPLICFLYCISNRTFHKSLSSPG